MIEDMATLGDFGKRAISQNLPQAYFSVEESFVLPTPASSPRSAPMTKSPSVSVTRYTMIFDFPPIAWGD